MNKEPDIVAVFTAREDLHATALALSKRRHRKKRRATALKVKQREALAKAIGLRAGSLSARQRKKIENSPGYMRDGHLRRYLNTGRNHRRRHLYEPSVRHSIAKKEIGMEQRFSELSEC